MKADATVIKHMAQLGLSERDSKLYLKCLQGGPATVQELAKALGDNRVTTHSAVERLLERGLLFETRRGKRRLIGAEEPDAALQWIQRKKNELQLMESHAVSLTELLYSFQAVNSARPLVRFFEGTSGFRKMLEETLSARGEVLVFIYVELFSGLIDAVYLENYFKRRAAKGIHTRLIFPPCEFASRVAKKSREYKIRVRLLPPEIKWRCGIFCWNQSVAILSLSEGRPTTTIIENADIADFYRRIIYEMCWNQAKPLQ